eukprot:scaffold13141_cov105-Isochrysis_galbana.AAC.2
MPIAIWHGRHAHGRMRMRRATLTFDRGKNTGLVCRYIVIKHWRSSPTARARSAAKGTNSTRKPTLSQSHKSQYRATGAARQSGEPQVLRHSSASDSASPTNATLGPWGDGASKHTRQ